MRLLAGDRSHVDGLGALLALGDVELDGAWPSSSEPSPWTALACANTSLPDSGWMKP